MLNLTFSSGNQALVPLALVLHRTHHVLKKNALNFTKIKCIRNVFVMYIQNVFQNKRCIVRPSECVFEMQMMT